MAAISGSTALQRRASPRTTPAKSSSRLRLVVTRRLGRTSRFNPAHRLAFATACLIFVVFLVVTVAQAVVASRQIRIDDLRQQLANSVAINENLQLQRAELTEPSRILSIAEGKLGMASPAKISYLAPVTPADLHLTSKAPTR